ARRASTNHFDDGGHEWVAAREPQIDRQQGLVDDGKDDRAHEESAEQLKARGVRVVGQQPGHRDAGKGRDGEDRACQKNGARPRPKEGQADWGTCTEGDDHPGGREKHHTNDEDGLVELLNALTVARLEAVGGGPTESLERRQGQEDGKSSQRQVVSPYSPK